MAKPRSLAEAVQNIDRVLKFSPRQKVLIGIPGEGRRAAIAASTTPRSATSRVWGARGQHPARPFLGPASRRRKR